eukprot:jgi/Mesvir1/13110/Mv06089-RA.1
MSDKADPRVVSAVHQDWEGREFIYGVKSSTRQLTDFLQGFEGKPGDEPHVCLTLFFHDSSRLPCPFRPSPMSENKMRDKLALLQERMEALESSVAAVEEKSQGQGR